MKNHMQKNSIQSMMITEILNKRKKQILSTKNLKNNQYMTNIKNLDLDSVMIDFGVTSLYPIAMWDEKSVYPEIETGFAFKPHKNDVFVEAFNIQTFNQDGNEFSISKLKNYNPPNLTLQYLPVKEKVKNIKVNRMRKNISLTR